MRFADELRDTTEHTFPGAGTVRPEELSMAEQLITNLTRPFEASKYEDDSHESLMRIIRAKLKGKKITAPEPASEADTKVIDLVTRLRESLAQAKAAPAERGHARNGHGETKRAARGAFREARAGSTRPSDRIGGAGWTATAQAVGGIVARLADTEGELLADVEDQLPAPHAGHDGRPVSIHEWLLLVDDDADTRAIYGRVLMSMGYRVLEAMTGRAAILLAQATTPDVVVLDLGLPDMDGLDVTRALRGDPRTCGILDRDLDRLRLERRPGSGAGRRVQSVLGKASAAPCAGQRRAIAQPCGAAHALR